MALKVRLAQAYYDLAILLDAGVPILRSFDILIEGRKGRLRQVFSQIRESLSRGTSLTESMGEHRRVFTDIDRMIVEAAETSGSLNESFKMLSQWHEFIHRITRQIWMGLMYPFLIVHLAAFILGAPALVLGQVSLLGYLRGVIGSLLFLWGPVIIVLVLLSIRETARAVRTPLDYLVLWVPWLGKAIYHLSICRYARAFGMLYKAGVPIRECTERAVLATGNAKVAKLFEGGVTNVRAGGMACEGFSKHLPAEYRQLWQIGEESGELDKTVDKIAEVSAYRADQSFTLFAFWLPRIVYFVILIVMAITIVKGWAAIYSGLLNDF